MAFLSSFRSQCGCPPFPSQSLLSKVFGVSQRGVDHLAPLSALIERSQQLKEGLVGEGVEHVGGAGLADVRKAGDCVGHHHGIGV